MPARIPDDVRAAVLADVEAGEKSAGRIARDHGVSRSFVSRLAEQAGAGDGWQRSQTKKATAAAAVDNDAKRAALAQAWLDLAADAVAQARAELAEARADKAATIAGIATDKHLALDKHEHGEADDRRGVLAALAAQLWPQPEHEEDQQTEG